VRVFFYPLLFAFSPQQRAPNSLQHALSALHHVGAPGANDPITSVLEEVRPPRVDIWIVLPTIQFDDQHRLDAGEVRNIRADGPLPSKFVSF
jgi:hypothetical protein